MTGERPLRIAFQGEAGSFSDEALQQLWGSEAERLPYRDFADVTAAVAAGVADRGVLPIENTIVGSIAASHDAINAMPSLFAVAETVVAVHHCLLAAHTNRKQVFAAMFQMRTEPKFRKLKSMLDAGELGRITRVSWIITDWYRTEA